MSIDDHAVELGHIDLLGARDEQIGLVEGVCHEGKGHAGRAA